MKTIDHLVYCVPNLEKGIEQFKNKFGIEPIYGGRHLHQGTHNALINLGNQCYFELLAPDPENKEIAPPRWMGVDLIKEPKLCRWAIKSDKIAEDLKILKEANPQLATSKTGMRKKENGSILNWELSLPLPYPEVEALPFLIDWKDSEHPTQTIQQEAELISFTIHHPQPEALAQVLKSLDIMIEIKQAEEVALIAQIQTLQGRTNLIDLIN